MLRVLFIGAYIAVTVYCIADAVQHPDQDPYGLPRWAWVAIILLFPYLGAGVWLFLKFSRRSGGTRPRSAGPIAPDDDPDYLRWLREQERRRKSSGEA
ncbi:PLD nuclease N-terminal domain-containing protein [Demequina sp. NBRC 110056]|uniref:PLD nuclease N-terminal domain-containing protein n=1 Tax=Demequina sp. NBRC 110056 TaxID=1570345 RepID=UPI0009FD2C90|nr:PLD nuclease N-terminal domain-containing protein [Demequina sp. NBRC 110056]